MKTSCYLTSGLMAILAVLSAMLLFAADEQFQMNPLNVRVEHQMEMYAATFIIAVFGFLALFISAAVAEKSR